MSEDETEVLTDADKRIIHQVTVDDVAKADAMFDDLMGTEIKPRKDYIKEHSAEATYGI